MRGGSPGTGTHVMYYNVIQKLTYVIRLIIIGLSTLY